MLLQTPAPNNAEAKSLQSEPAPAPKRLEIKQCKLKLDVGFGTHVLVLRTSNLNARHLAAHVKIAESSYRYQIGACVLTVSSIANLRNLQRTING